MLTPTPRLGLVRPEDLDQAQIEDINANSDKIDASTAIAQVVVSGQLPATPYKGQLVWDDTGKKLSVWTGSKWETGVNVPPGGAGVGMALTKSSATDYALVWRTLIPLGGATGAVLKKTSSADFASTWTTEKPSQFDSGAIGFVCPGSSIVDTSNVTFTPAFSGVVPVVYGFKTNENSANLIIELKDNTATYCNFRIRNLGSVSNTGVIYYMAGI